MKANIQKPTNTVFTASFLEPIFSILSIRAEDACLEEKKCDEWYQKQDGQTHN